MTLRRLMAVLCTVSLVSGNSFAAPSPVDQLTAQLASDSALLSGWMTDNLKYVIPFNSTSGNVVPSQLQLFGVEVGVEGVVSGTKMDVDALHNLPTQTVNAQTIDMFSRLPLPMVLGHAKVGLPFGIDAGVRVGGIPKTNENSGTAKGSIQNKVFGLDLRKKIVDEGALKPFGLTMGLSYTHADGSLDISNTYDSLPAQSYQGHTIGVQDGQSTDHADWNTNSIGLQAIMDKKIFFITPYIGASVNRNSGHINNSMTTTGTPVVDGVADPADTVSASAASTDDANKWDVRGLAGLEFTLFPFVKLGLGGEYAGNKNMAGSLGLRIQFH